MKSVPWKANRVQLQVGGDCMLDQRECVRNSEFKSNPGRRRGTPGTFVLVFLSPSHDPTVDIDE